MPPDRPERTKRLSQALDRVAADPPRVVAGDALAALPGVLAAVPPGLRVVVASLGTLVYLPPADRRALVELTRSVHLVTLEPETALPEIATARAALVAEEPTPFILALDGRPLACASPHGDRLSWLQAPKN